MGKKLRENPGMRVGVRGWKVLLEWAEAFVMTFGSAHLTKVICLPADWKDEIESVYKPGRCITIENPRELKESIIIDILTNQVDEYLQPWTYGVLMISGKVGVYVVPRSPFWLKRAEAGE